MDKISARSIPMWCILLCAILFSESEASVQMQIIHMESLCYGKSLTTHTLGRNLPETGILKTSELAKAYFNCTAVLKPSRQSQSIALGIYKYTVYKEDILSIEDVEGHKIGLIGNGLFTNERKSIISKGKITIYYTRNNTSSNGGFQFTYTAQNEPPCTNDEYMCENRMCIPKVYMCDKHNHCGDRSDEKNCVLKDTKTVEISKKDPSSFWILTSAIGGSVLIIFIIILILTIIMFKKQRKAATPSPGNGPQSPPSTVPQVGERGDPMTAENTFFNRIRRSLRGHREPRVEEQQKEQKIYQVPNMYPSLEAAPSAPTMEGIDNRQFRSDE